MGLCSAGPLVAVAEPGSDLAGSVLYRDVKPDDVADILASVGAAPLQRLRCPTDQPFFARQQRIVLENSGVIDPESLREYIAADGYAALEDAIRAQHPYEMPAIHAIAIAMAYLPYAEWVEASTRPEPGAD